MVAQEEREDVVRAVMAGLGDEGQVWGVCATVGVSGGLLVGVGAGQRVAQLAGSGEHLSFIVGAILYLNLDRRKDSMRQG